MSVIYKKIQQIIGPLLFLKNEHDAKYGEIVIINTDDGKSRTGQIVKMSEEVRNPILEQMKREKAEREEHFRRLNDKLKRKRERERRRETKRKRKEHEDRMGSRAVEPAATGGHRGI